MGEIAVKPISNVFKKYKSVIYVNPYILTPPVAANPFVSTWKTDNLSAGSSTATQIKLPLIATGIYNMTVNWGDGTSSLITSWDQAAVTKTYATAGTYTVSITGTCNGWRFNGNGDRLKFLSVSSWGVLRLAEQSGAFRGCVNLNLTGVTDILNLTGVVSLLNMFLGCTSLTTINRLGEWDLSNVSTLTQAFSTCDNFNQNVGTWNVSNVTDLSYAFASCLKFDNGGSDSINNWNTAKVTSLAGTFSNCYVFNRNIGSWNVSNVTDMNTLFNGALIFNKNIGSWNVAKVANMRNLFGYAQRFNQNIGSWNVGLVNDMFSMFIGANDFNQDISSWNVANVSNMSNMFSSAPGFNQNIGAWNVSNVTNFNGFMGTKTPATFSSANLNAIYNGWSTRSVVTGRSISFGTAKYTAAATSGRSILTSSPNNWTITDGGI